VRRSTARRYRLPLCRSTILVSFSWPCSSCNWGTGSVLCPRGAARERRHHLFRKQAQRAQRLRVGQGTPGERTDYVVAATHLQQLGYLLAHTRWRAEENSLVLGGRLPGEEAIGKVVAVFVPQLGDRVKPVGVGSARGCQRLSIGIRHDDLAQDAYL